MPKQSLLLHLRLDLKTLLEFMLALQAIPEHTGRVDVSALKAIPEHTGRVDVSAAGNS